MPPKIPQDLVPVDTALPADLVPADLIPADTFAQLPSEISLSDQNLVQQAPAFELPTSLTQQTIAPERAAVALASGALAIPRTVIAATEALAPQPLQTAIDRAEIKVPTLEEIATKATAEVPIVSQALSFKAQTPIEVGAEFLGGLAFEAPRMQVSKGAQAIAKESEKLIGQAEASEAARLALVKRGADVATPTTPSPKVTSEVLKELSTNDKLRQRYSQKPLDSIIFGAEDAKSAKSLDKRLTNLETKRLGIEEQLQAADLLPENKVKLDNELLKVNTKYEQLKREGQKTLESPAYKALTEAKSALGETKIKLDGKEVLAYNKVISKQGAFVSPQEIEILQNQPLRTIPDVSPQEIAALQTEGKPVGKFASGPFSTVDHVRLLQEADGFQVRGPKYQLLFEPLEQAAVARERATLTETNNFRNLVNDLQIGTLDTKRKELLFDVADGKIAAADANLTSNEQTFLNYIAKKYNDYLSDINAVRSKLGYEPIKARKNYITHIQEIDFYNKLGFGIDSADATPALNKFTKKLKAAFAFEKQRLGTKAVKDPIQAFEAYIDPAMKQKFYTEPAAVVHARTNFLTDPNLRQAQRRLVNEAFLGGLDFKDQALYEAGLAPVLKAAETLSSITSRGVILANVKVISSQPSQILATVKETGTWPTIVGLKRATQAIPEELSKASSFLTLRKISDDLVPINQGILKKPAQFATSLLEFADKYVARASWHAGFAKAQSRGWDIEASVKYADDVARMLHANYNEIYKAPLTRGKVGRAAFPLTTFAFNAWNHLVRDPKVLAELKNTSRLRETMKILGAMVATNQVYEQLGIPTPFEISLPENLTVEDVAASAKEFALGNIPLARSLQYGTPSPALSLVTREAQLGKESLLKNSYLAVFSEDEEKKEEAIKQLKKLGAPYVPGGLQAYKTLEGLNAARDGFVQYGRDVIILDEKDKKIAPIFGVYQTPSVKKARKEKELQQIRQSIGKE
jgi:hypothetical protein